MSKQEWVKEPALLRAMQRCGLIYVAHSGIGRCNRCGFLHDLRMGAQRVSEGTVTFLLGVLTGALIMPCLLIVALGVYGLIQK